MKGLSPHTIPVFNLIRDLNILQDYYLIDGTALSLQIQHRLSEDLNQVDFFIEGVKVSFTPTALQIPGTLFQS